MSRRTSMITAELKRTPRVSLGSAMRKSCWVVLALIVVISAPVAHADSFSISWTGGFGPGSVTVDATNEGGGEFLITSLTGTQVGSPVTLQPTGTYGNNTNLIFPGGGPSGSCSAGISPTSQLDNCGFTFTDGTSNFNIFSAILEPGTYWECDSSVTTTPNCVASPQFPGTPGVELTSFSITPLTTAPEPVTGLLLLTGFAGLYGVGLRRKSLG